MGATRASPSPYLRQIGHYVYTGDTALHIAAAVGTPCLGLYGPTSGTRNGPYGSGHRVIESADRRMTSIAPAAVLSAATAMLEAA